MGVPADNPQALFASLRHVIGDIDLVLGDYYSGLPEDHCKARPAYSRLTSLIYTDMDGEVTCTPEEFMERALCYGDSPEPPTDREMGQLLPPREAV